MTTGFPIPFPYDGTVFLSGISMDYFLLKSSNLIDCASMLPFGVHLPRYELCLFSLLPASLYLNPRTSFEICSVPLFCSFRNFYFSRVS